MRFDLRKPCVQCPFRPDAGSYLNEERAREIALAVSRDNLTFACHKTLSGDYDEDPEGDDTYRPGAEDQMCAGAMAFVDKLGAPNQMLQIAERVGLRDPKRLLPAALDDVYDSVEAMAAGHARDRRSPARDERDRYAET